MKFKNITFEGTHRTESFRQALIDYSGPQHIEIQYVDFNTYSTLLENKNLIEMRTLTNCNPQDSILQSFSFEHVKVEMSPLKHGYCSIEARP